MAQPAIARPFSVEPSILEQVTPPAGAAHSVQTIDLAAWYGTRRAIGDVNLTFRPGQISAIIGPSGCGKSTLVRCLNRLHEVTPGGRVEGRVVLNGEPVYGPGVDPVLVRRRVGMVFQRPNPFPTMSIFENVAAGLLLNGVSPG